MQLEDFDYYLPKDLIAQFPLECRQESKLLVFKRATGTIEHKSFFQVGDYLKEGDLLVLNDTKVLPARFLGNKTTGGKVDILIVEEKDNNIFNCLVKPQLKPGDEVILAGGKLKAQCLERNLIKFYDFKGSVYDFGVMPLPPYIKRAPQQTDTATYQTIYAKNNGAIAAPTAGLHFTKELFDQFKSMKIKTAYVTLHVGHGTFKPIKENDITKHKMHSERFYVSREAVCSIRDAKKNNNRIIAVGTTSCRVLESIAGSQGSDINDDGLNGQTDLFIYPGYKFKLTDCLITNFHLPKSTLLLLVSAFIGQNKLKDVYQTAIENRYRFYSYGDAMMIL